MENDKLCRICNKKKQFPTEFPKTKLIKGKQYFRRICKKCHNKKKNERRKRVRKQVVEYKSKLACEVCGYSKQTHKYFTVEALDFHHVYDNKEFSIGDGSNKGKSFINIKKEIDKCQVLCCRCHKQMHKK